MKKFAIKATYEYFIGYDYRKRTSAFLICALNKKEAIKEARQCFEESYHKSGTFNVIYIYEIKKEGS